MRHLIILIVLTGLLGACSQSGNQTETSKSAAVTAATRTVILKVDGMTCSGCETTIQQAVSELPGVSSVKADYTAGKATVSYDTTKTRLNTIADAIKNTGYQVVQ